MSGWAPPRPSKAALDALASIAAPSRPQPLPGSRFVGPDTYLTNLTRDQVIAAYTKTGAPLPPESTVDVRDGVPVISSPFGTAGLIFSRAPIGCVYRIVGRPTLTIEGKGALPSASLFTPVGYDDTDMEGKPRTILVAAPTIGGKPWVLFAGDLEDDSGNAPATGAQKTAIFAQATFADMQAAGDNWQGSRYKAAFSRDGDVVLVEIDTPRGKVKVRAIPTHSSMALLGSLAAEAVPTAVTIVSCTKKNRQAANADKIVSIGGKDASGKKWRLSQAEAIAKIEAGEKYYVDDDGDGRIPVAVANSSGKKYLVAKRQGERTNLLLHLPTCR